MLRNLLLGQNMAWHIFFRLRTQKDEENDMEEGKDYNKMEEEDNDKEEEKEDNKEVEKNVKEVEKDVKELE